MPDTHLRSRAVPDFTPHRPRSPRRQRPDPCAEPCTPRCPACGGLKCLCRPRFFPGQLLTDDDLNRLEQYVIDKNRLHNRYLHGWGVACGLEVVCDMCDKDHVVVRSGYALSPCGDDIVVCGDQSVDVCALINQCADREPLCDPPYDRPPRDCTGGVRTWVLAICYDERPVRGVTAQLGAGDTTCGTCSCGGSGSCGCSGGSSRAGGRGYGGGPAKNPGAGGCSCGGDHSTMPPRRKPHTPQCEPTQICEGYRFVAYPTSEPKDLDITGTVGNKDLLWTWLYANRSQFGPLLERVLCCITKAMELRQQIREGRLLNRAFALTAYTEYAGALYEFASAFGVHRCSFQTRTLELRDEARAFNWDAARFPDDNARHAELYLKVQALDHVWLDIVAECLCSALLPACPQPADTNCVPLAVVTISDGECRVVDICNWSQRKLLITWPTITYWLSWIPWHRLLKVIADMCCGPDRKGHAMSLMTLMLGVAFSGMKATAVQPMRLRAGTLPFPGAAAAAPGAGAGAARIDPLTEALDADNLLVHMLDRFTRLRTEGPDAVDEPGWAGLIARIADASALSPRAEDDPRLAAIMRRLDDAERDLDWLKRGQ